MKKLSLIVFVLLGTLVTLSAQKTVTGTVYDSAKDPILGATVSIQGTTTGVITDMDGNFSITLPSGKNILLITYVGYTDKSVDVTNLTTVNVELSQGEILEEVVVTALGIKRDKKSLGYSVTNLTADDITQRSEADPIRALAGKVAGVNITGAGGAPGQSTKINIRGFSSLTGNTQPLFVVDGIPFDNSVNSNGNSTQFSNRGFDIDPNNIETVSVLKGAAAAALYGSRATNGVILITTKGGKKSKKGLEVTYNSSYAQERVSSLPNYQNVYAQGSNQNYNGGFIGNWGAPFPNHVDRINNEFHAGNPRYSSTYAAGYPAGTVPHPMGGGIPFTNANGYANIFPQFTEVNPNNPNARRAVPLQLQPYNQLEDFFKVGNLLENSLSIATGDENQSINATISRMQNNGIVDNSTATRTTIAVGGNAKLSNGLSINANVNYVNSGQTSPPIAPSYYTDYGGADDASIYSRLFYLPRNVDLNWPFENPVNGDNAFYRALDNPRWLTKYNQFTSNVNRSFGAVTLAYPLTSWLTANARGGFNTYTDGQVSNTRSGGIDDPNGGVYNRDITNTELDFNYFLTANKKITSDIDLTVTAGFNQNQRSRKDKLVTGDGIIDNNVQNLASVTTVLTTFDDKTLQRLYAGYADVNFGFRNYLYLGLTIRNDVTSTLVNPVDFKNSQNSYYYPGVSSSFVVSDAFNLTSTPIDFLKVRASYTQVGNEATPYLTSTVYNINNPFVSASGNRINRASLSNLLGKADLVNELTKEIEFGADIKLFKNRLGMDFAWFKRNSFDQITRTDLPTSSGFTQSVINAGEIQNAGIELGLNFEILRSGKGLNWNANLNFTRIRSLIVDAGEGSEIIVGGVADIGNIHREGLPYGQLFGTKNARVDNNDPTSPLLINKTDGLPFLLPTNEIVGDPNPDFLMGLINTFTFKGVSLMALVDWKQGGDFFSSTASSLLLRGQLAFQEDREAFRVVPGVYGDPSTFQATLDESGKTIKNTTGVTPFESHFTRGFGAYGASETNIYDATVFRLREVSLSYAFPRSLVSKTPFGSFKMSFSGRNLWFKAPNMLQDINTDPEVLGFTAGSNIQGIELGSTPNTRRFGVNLSATF